MKVLKSLAAVFVALFAFSACSDDPATVLPESAGYTNGFYVLNQGNVGFKVQGTLDRLDYSANAYTTSVTTLGLNPQNSTAQLNGKLYIADNAAGSIYVVNVSTNAVEATIPSKGVQGVAAAGGYLFAVGNDSISRIVPGDNAVMGKLPVGKNPYGILAVDNHLYVTIGGTYGVFTDGNHVVKVDADNFKIGGMKRIAVGTNPYNQLAVDGNKNVYVACSGNYADIPAKVYQISPSDEVNAVGAGNYVAACGNNVYIVNATTTDWTNYTTTYTVYNSARQATGQLLADDTRNVSFIKANPLTGEVYIGSNPAGWLPAAGTVTRHAADGTLTATYTTGVNPVSVIFF